AAALAALLEGKLVRSAAYLLVAGAAALFGVIHSPLPDAPIALPNQVYRQLEWNPRYQVRAPDQPVPEKVEEPNPDARFLSQSPHHWAAAYGACATLLLALAAFPARKAEDREPLAA